MTATVLTASSRLTTPARADRLRADRGVVAVWFAVLLTVIFGFAAMAVDLGLWYVARSRVQAATDAAALGGAALLPDNPDDAVDEAILIAEQHGFPENSVDVVVENDSQLYIRIEAEIDNVFLPVLGFGDTQTISADARAEYEGTVSMGSPDAGLGSDAEQTGSPGYVSPDIWLAFLGRSTTKANGDRYGTYPCGGAPTGCTSDVNNEYDPAGYFFQVNVTDNPGEDLLIQAFDPIWGGTGGSCNGTGSGSPFPTAAQAAALTALTATAAYSSGGQDIPQGWFDDAATRYQAGDGDWCSGDQHNGRTATTRMATSFVVRTPDETPWNNYDNPIIDTGTCEPESFSAYRLEPNTGGGAVQWDGSVYGVLDPTEAPHGVEWDVDYSDDVWTFSETFRRWVTVCRVPEDELQIGTYLLQIRTNASPTDPGDPADAWNTTGLNALSIRAGFDDGTDVPDPGGHVTVSAAGRLPLFANLQNGDSYFYLARVLPTSRERNLTVELFDAGDIAGGGSTSIQVLPPDDAQSPELFTDCQFQLDGVSSISTNPATCTITNITQPVYNGRAMIVQVPLSSSYDCNASADDGCWVRLKITYAADANDFTTWSAYISGDPVRLIE